MFGERRNTMSMLGDVRANGAADGPGFLSYGVSSLAALSTGHTARRQWVGCWMYS
jgi:hypothetical protein